MLFRSRNQVAEVVEEMLVVVKVVVELRVEVLVKELLLVVPQGSDPPNHHLVTEGVSELGFGVWFGRAKQLSTFPPTRSFYGRCELGWFRGG